MHRLLLKFFPVAALAGGWFFLQNFQIESFDPLKIVARKPAASAPSAPSKLPAVRPGETLRIATFNIQVFGEAKLSDAVTASRLAEIMRKFDVVAIQEIRAKDANFLYRFLDLVNAAGVPYDCVIGPRLGRTDSKEQYAFVFDTTRIELDRVSVYTVKDPDDLLHREPLVAGFRARGPSPQEAFTFTLINIHTMPSNPERDRELDVLDDVYRAVRDDGRGEDDIILLGDFNAPETGLRQLGQVPYLQSVISQVPTMARGTATYDNILFDRRATTEFTGRAEVVDVMRQFNITLDEVLKMSDHLPVWAEFSVYEGGRPGHVAAKP